MSDLSYREFLIPKKNGKPRRICAPSTDLKAYQRKQLRRLEGVFKDYSTRAGVNDNFHGFLTGRNCITGAEKHIGYETTIMMDIKDFFDSVTKEHFKHIPEVVNHSEHLFHEDGYTPQGFVTSPILANIATINIISELRAKLTVLDPWNVVTIYADDIQVSILKVDNYKLEEQIKQLVTDVFKSYGFEINPRKTRTRRAKYGYRKILGVNVGSDHIRATRRIMRKIRAAKHQSKHHSLGGLTTWSKCMLPRVLRGFTAP